MNANPQNPDTIVSPQMPNQEITKISTAICIISGIVLFFGYLPRFAPYFVLTPSAFISHFPKFWTLFTGPFYFISLFSGVLDCFGNVIILRLIEPILGSKEVVHIIVISIFYSNLIYLLFAFLFYAIFQNQSILSHIYLCSGNITGMFTMTLAYLFYNIRMPLSLFELSFRKIPFIYFIIQLIFFFAGDFDGLISIIISYFVSYIYFRFIKKKNGIRGDQNFNFSKLLPDCCGGSNPDEEDIEDIVHREEDTGFHPQHFGGNNNQTRQPPTNSPFQGHAHTINRN